MRAKFTILVASVVMLAAVSALVYRTNRQQPIVPPPAPTPAAVTGATTALHPARVSTSPPPAVTVSRAQTADVAELLRQAEAEAGSFLWYRRIAAALQEWAKQDPRAAAQYVLGIPADKSADFRKRMLHDILAAWAEADPDAALAWAKSVSDESDRIEALAGALPGWARRHTDPIDLSFLPADKQETVLRQVTLDWVKKDPAAALAYAFELDRVNWSTNQNQQEYHNFSSELLGRWAATDPRAAAEYVLTLPGDAERYNRTPLEIVVGAWAAADSAAAFAWAQSVKNDSARDAALTGMAVVIADRDTAKAETIIAGIQDNNARDRAYLDLVTSILRANPQNLQLALRFTDNMSRVPAGYVRVWIGNNRGNPTALTVLRGWVEQAQAAGRLQYASPDPDQAAAEYRQILQSFD